MVLSCGSLHHGCACWARAMWKQRACSSGWRRRRQEAGWKGESGGGGRRGSFAALNLVFFRSGELVVYCLAVAAWFSTGLICHPIKNRTGLVDTEWESASLLCSSKKDGEDKSEKQSDWQIRQEREHLWITGSCHKTEEREDVGRKQIQSMKKKKKVNGFQLGRRRGRKVKTGKMYACVCVWLKGWLFVFHPLL